MDSLFEDIQQVLLAEKVDVDAMLADVTDPARIEKWWREVLTRTGKEQSEEEIKTTAKTYANVASNMIRNDVEKVKSWKKDDRVQVGIRHIKFICLFLLIHDEFPSEEDAIVFMKSFKFVRKMDPEALRATSVVAINLSSYGAMVTRSVDNVSQYLELNIPEVQNYTFDPKKSLNQNLYQIELAVEEHNKAWEGWAQVDEDAGEKIVKYYKEQKLAWFNLNTAYCPKEREAMGHCGNSPRSHTDDVIYSLSNIKQRHDKVWFRQPHVTAILEDDGMFGEIRGKQNKRPVDKYAPFIKDLMLLEGVKGMKGPRWPEEEGNWSWEDFSEDQQEEILAAKPNFDYEGSSGEKDSHSSRYIRGDDFDPNELLDEIPHLHNVTITSIEDNGDFVVDTVLSIGDFAQRSNWVMQSITDAFNEMEYVYPDGMDEDEAEELHEERVSFFIDLIYAGFAYRTSDEAWEEFQKNKEELQYDPKKFFAVFLHENLDFFKRFYSEILNQKEFDFITPEQKEQRIINAIYKNLESKGIFEDDDGMPPEFDVLFKNTMKTLAEDIMSAYNIMKTDRSIDDLDLDRADMIRVISRSEVATMADDYMEMDIDASDAIGAVLDRSFMDDVEGWEPEIEFQSAEYQRLFDLLFDPSAYRLSKPAEIRLKTKIEQAFKR